MHALRNIHTSRRTRKPREEEKKLKEEERKKEGKKRKVNKHFCIPRSITKQNYLAFTESMNKWHAKVHFSEYC